MRSIPLKHPVTVHFDGEAIPAERGEPVAVALLAAGKLSLARSAKFHRPRGPSCLRAACDGCLARVDDRPNVMTCMVPAAEGTVVTTQNTLGSREMDFLRVTDWFFPNGMNHHELFAGVPGLQGIMQSFARRVAGLGKLPVQVSAARGAQRRGADVVVVGAGAGGDERGDPRGRRRAQGRGDRRRDRPEGDAAAPSSAEDAAPWAPLRGAVRGARGIGGDRRADGDDGRRALRRRPPRRRRRGGRDRHRARPGPRSGRPRRRAPLRGQRRPRRHEREGGGVAPPAGRCPGRAGRGVPPPGSDGDGGGVRARRSRASPPRAASRSCTGSRCA